MLFRGNAETLDKCDICGTSRYKQSNEFSDGENEEKKIAAK